MAQKYLGATVAPLISSVNSLELTQYPHWVVWKLEKREGSTKPTKVPYNALTGAKASSTDGNTWGHYSDAVAAYETGEYSGIGFVVSEFDHFVGVDLDHCVDEQGNISDWAQKIVTDLDSYTELSPSGTGLRIWCEGKLPPNCRNRKGNTEVYETGRFLTVTGSKIPHGSSAINNRTNELKIIVDTLGSSVKPERPKVTVLPSVPDDLLNKAFASTKGEAIRRLYDGDTSGYASASEADLALVNHLLWWASGDLALTDDLFRRSGLYRDKWDEKHGTDTYGNITLDKALESFEGGYSATLKKGTGKVTTPTVAPQDDSEDESDNPFKRRLIKARSLVGERLRFNQLTREIELDGSELDSGDLQAELAEHHNLWIPSTQSDLIFRCIAKQNAYHPIKDYLNEVYEKHGGSYDLSTNAKRFLGTDNQLHNLMVRKFLIAAVARVFDPGCKCDSVLILQGRQGAGKSTFLEALASSDWFEDGVKDVSDKDELFKMHRVWVAEWAELETVFKRRDISMVKAFLTSKTDRAREPYGRVAKTLPRGFVIAGTTNQTEFLGDPTGSRRFWVVPVKVPKIDTEALRADRDRLWGAAVAAYRAGERWWLNNEHEALSEASNTSYQMSDVWEPIIEEYVHRHLEVTTADVLIKGLNKEQGNLTRADQMRVADILKRLGWEQIRRREGANRARVWVRSEAENDYVGKKVGQVGQVGQLPSDSLHHKGYEVGQPRDNLGTTSDRGRVNQDSNGSSDQPCPNLINLDPTSSLEVGSITNPVTASDSGALGQPTQPDQPISQLSVICSEGDEIPDPLKSANIDCNSSDSDRGVVNE